jgi:hypothetical protein
MRRYGERLNTTRVATGRDGNSILLQAIVKKCGDGSLFFCWTGGGAREPDNRNVTKYCRSFDNGQSWTEERILFQHPVRGMFTPQLFVEKNSLYAFPNTYSPDTGYALDLQSYWSVSRDNGETFSPLYNLAGCLASVQVRSLIKVKGKLIAAVSWHENDGEKWAPPFGDKACIVAGNVIEPSPSIQDWHRQICTEYCGVIINEGDPFTTGSWHLYGRIGERKSLSFCEPQLVELTDGTLVMLLRIGKPWVYESRSYDGGLSWSDPVPTRIPSAMSLVRIITDSNGVVYLIHNPNPAGRSPLELWISNDNMQSWQNKIVLVEDTQHWCCYPEGFLDQERGVLCLSWDDRKNVYYSEFKLD